MTLGKTTNRTTACTTRWTHRRQNMWIICDAKGNPWTWDREAHSLYQINATDRESKEFNGFVCDSWGEAVEILNDEGYMFRDGIPIEATNTEYKDWFDPKESYLPD